jgi:hypothetical protein
MNYNNKSMLDNWTANLAAIITIPLFNIYDTESFYTNIIIYADITTSIMTPNIGKPVNSSSASEILSLNTQFFWSVAILTGL